jgi:dCTP deaminase
MILSAQTLRKLQPVSPFVERTIFNGMSYGLSSAGYDIRIAQTVQIEDKGFTLASSMERFQMPGGVLGIVHDKSSWARQGISVQNTVIEPGWEGYLTLELNNNSDDVIEIFSGSPIAQIIFHFLDQPTETPYQGKYQNQKNEPVGAIYENA